MGRSRIGKPGQRHRTGTGWIIWYSLLLLAMMVTIAGPILRLVRDGIILANKEQFEEVVFVPSERYTTGRPKGPRAYFLGQTAEGEKLSVRADDLRKPEVGKTTTIWRRPGEGFSIGGASTRVVGDARFAEVTLWEIVKLAALVASMMAVSTFAGRRMVRIAAERR